MIWAESLTNPTLKYTDLEALVRISNKQKVSVLYYKSNELCVVEVCLSAHNSVSKYSRGICCCKQTVKACDRQHVTTCGSM